MARDPELSQTPQTWKAFTYTLARYMPKQLGEARRTALSITALTRTKKRK